MRLIHYYQGFPTSDGDPSSVAELEGKRGDILFVDGELVAVWNDQNKVLYNKKEMRKFIDAWKIVKNNTDAPVHLTFLDDLQYEAQAVV